MAKFSDFQEKNQLSDLFLVGYDSTTGNEIRIPASMLTPQAGEPGASVQINYSANGEDWHSALQEGDGYYRQKIGTGTWTPAIPLGGEQGEQGEQGPDGIDGKSIYTGTTAPDPSLYNVGDLYLNTFNYNLYQKTAEATWTPKGNIKGAQGIQGIQGNNGVDGQRGTQVTVGGYDPPIENTYPNDVFINSATGEISVADDNKNWNVMVAFMIKT